ncbi:hypothetical protein [Tepidibacillus sp. HK-1]|uniref:hypothetical protein n=1 Tax=Tepidibacillus sp. HK-1 TaxID=1883407 RepID=UPI000853CE78|nr:hypothetical protein [Tepidibacillus sp. HK-1]GBF12646.1 hypothetical protein HK1_02729 [Tepidibacillus sp. HK-1]
MDKVIIEQLQNYFPIKWFKSYSGSGWFLLEITPYPPIEELESIISDIINDKIIDVLYGQVRHSLTCNEKHHIPANIKKVLPNLKEQTFLVAVHPGNFNVYQGQPIAVAIEPQINYNIYPDHPHLNVGNFSKLDGQEIFIPDSFCYTDNPSKLGFDPLQRLLKALSLISIWLLRHQIWLLTREQLPKSEWIGPEAKPFKPEEYPKFLNPLGYCRCGKKIKYKDCHMIPDLKSDKKEMTSTDKQNKEIYYNRFILKSIHNWMMYKGNPQENFFKEFKKII